MFIPPTLQPPLCFYPPSTIDVQNGMVAQYKFDGNFADSSIYGEDGSPVNLSVSISYDLVLSASSEQYVDCGPSPQTNFSGSDFTICVWINPTTVGPTLGGGNAGILCHGGPFLGGGYQLEVGSEGDIKLFYGTSTQFEEYQSSIYTTFNNWNFVVCVKKSTTMSMYINNIYDGTTTDALIDISSANLIIGAQQFNLSPAYFSEYYDGLIDDVRIYNRAITPLEINILYKNGPQ